MQRLKLKMQLFITPKSITSDKIGVRNSLIVTTYFKKTPPIFSLDIKKIQVFWLKKFPYGIYFIEEDLEIYIIAFWHSKEDIPNKINTVL